MPRNQVAANARLYMRMSDGAVSRGIASSGCMYTYMHAFTLTQLFRVLSRAVKTPICPCKPHANTNTGGKSGGKSVEKLEVTANSHKRKSIL